jgi:penicillin-binding protein 1C
MGYYSPEHPSQNRPRRDRRRPRSKQARRIPTPPYAQPGITPPPGRSTPLPGQPAYPGQPPTAHRSRRRRGLTIGPGCIFGCIGIVGVMVLGFLIVSFVVYEHYSSRLEGQVAKLKDLENYQSFETSVIYDRNGNELYEVINEGRRTKIPLDQIPQNMSEATIALEDDTFYQNRGIDIPSIIRAGWQYVRYGYIVSGGSTITQQLIRNVLFTDEYRYEQSLNRKMDEALLAVILTQRMSKNEILELYLNEIPYGNWSYGVEAASETYFGKPASQLTLGEAALLAGLPQAPADLDPLNPDPNVQRRVMERRKLVLDLMVQEGYITRAEADAAYAEPLNFVSPNIEMNSAPHMVVYAQDELENLLLTRLNMSQDEVKKMIARGGLRIYTSVDMDYQRLAEAAVSQQVAQMRDTHHMTNAAVVIVRPDTGEILAMVGSVNFNDESIDGEVNVTIAARQPGSAMKPFTYASAMEKGWTAANILWDTETQIGLPGQAPYIPVDYDRAFHGPVRVREALANSYNIAAVQTLRQVGVEYLLWMMNRVGVQSLGGDASQYGLSLTLGGGEVTPLELTTAYAVLANGGVYVPNTSIVCITNSAGDIIYEYEGRCPSSTRLTNTSVSVLAEGRPVMDPRIAFVISNILADNQARTPAMGSNSPLYTPGIPTSVKTGTTNDFRDNWTVGFTRNIAIGVWAGNTDNTPMVDVSGLQGAAPVWNEIMTGIYGNPALLDKLGQRLPDDAHLQPPGGVYQRQICNISRTALKDPAMTCTPGYFEWFLDSPAAVPDQNGNLIPQPPTPAPQLSANGPQPVEIEPGLIKVAVFPVDPNLANAIAAADTTGNTVPPRYCQVPVEVASAVPGVQEQLFVAPPPVPEDAFRARLWAQANGVAILPQFACNEQMLSTTPTGPQVVVANITSPTPGQTFHTSDQIDIVGTAAFTPEQAWFYKIELKGGQWAEFTPIQDISYNGVTNGVLGTLQPWAVPPGDYIIQLVIIGRDGNWLQAPYQVPFHVTG